MRIDLMIGGVRAAGELYDHPVAQELAALLPLTVVMDDFNRVEKVGRLDKPLTLRGVPHGDAPEPGEIGYYAPSRGLVLYYGSVSAWPGLVRMGRFDFDLGTLRDMSDGTEVSLAAAQGLR